jgi:mono/diheme cytochrome c family protein
MRRLALFAALATALLLALAACGNEEDRQALPTTVEGDVPVETGATDTGEGGGGGEVEGDPAAGAEVFTSAGCGSCHVLEAAGSSGAVGPNLDESQPSYDLVVDRVTNGAGAMPAFQGTLTDEQIQDVSAYVVESTSG